MPTYDEYRADDKRYELLNGELMPMPTPNRKHQQILGALCIELASWERCTSVPSTSFSRRAHDHRRERAWAPDLVIEVLSPATAEDVGCKHDLYSRHGVLEYWVVDPIAATVAVHRQQGGKLELAGRFSGGETLETPLLEGLQLELDEIFA